MHSAEFTKALNDLRTSVTRGANTRMRLDYLVLSDTALGARIAKSRKKGSDFAFQMMLTWSPIRWVRTDGLSFEIGQEDFRALGKDALDPRIDDIVVDEIATAIMNPKNDFLGELIRDAILNGYQQHYELEQKEPLDG